MIHCERCFLDGPGPYCVGCGALLQDATLEALATGQFDWQQWQQQMQPFLYGLRDEDPAMQGER